MCNAGAQLLLALRGGHAETHNVGRVLGAGAQAALLMAAEIGRFERLALAVPDEQCADALGRVDLVAGDGERIDLAPFLQVDGHAQPRLHGVHMEVGAAVARLNALAQRRDVLHGAGLVVDGHAGGQYRVFVDLGQEFLRVNASVRPGHDLDDGEALVLQRADGALHAGVFKARDDDLIAPVLTRAGRAGHGHVVALTAAGREVDFIAAAVQRFGHAGAGRGNGILRGNGGVIQAAGVGPKLSQRLADGLRHRRVHPGRGGVIKIMQLGVGKHSTHSSHYCTKLYRLNYTRSPSKKQYSETKKGFPRGGSWPRSGLMRAEFILIAHLRAVTR